MAKGQILKKEVMNKILEAFPGSFLYNDGKEVRINGNEEGEQIQIKLTFTASKVMVEPGEDNAIPAAAAIKPQNEYYQAPKQETEKVIVEPTDEERANVKKLLSSLGL